MLEPSYGEQTCCNCGKSVGAVVVEVTPGQAAPTFSYCAECLCRLLELVTDYQWVRMLKAFEASTATSKAIKVARKIEDQALERKRTKWTTG